MRILALPCAAFASVTAALLVAACGGNVAPQGAGPDAGPTQDGSVLDSAKGADTATSADSSRLDSSSILVDAVGVDVPIPVDTGTADTSVTVDSSSTVPVNHRPNDSECLAPAPAGNCTFTMMGGPPGGCTADSQCTMGSNGRCDNDGPIAGCSCTYDACKDDTGCQTGELCVCHGSAYTNGEGNTCLPGNCRVDSDCGHDGYCSPSAGTQNCGGVTGYYCHTAQDECVNDSDCNGQSAFNVCAWSATSSRWECQMQAVCAFLTNP